MPTDPKSAKENLRAAALEYHEYPRPGKGLRRAILPNSTLTGDANLLVCPGIDAANISYNLLKTAAGGNISIGPLLLGAAQPVHVLMASATVRRIVNTTALLVAESNVGRSVRKDPV